jgi:hypothetical protein
MRGIRAETREEIHSKGKNDLPPRGEVPQTGELAALWAFVTAGEGRI